ncbi:unnamed protein product [Prorocentrum cordatum]|uniref:Apple domain-containing protein n=1 Tax=Prorocentrum cordatum TaxID=2364126 RepID=A0ABN9WNW7_9DINO|nr:unnamed protein product [Polarella glacialis]
MIYQQAACADNGRHACYLYTGECNTVKDTCFNWAEIPFDQRPPATWRLLGPKLGCGSWEDIKLEPVSHARNAEECNARCASLPGCKYGHFQFRSGPVGRLTAFKNACYLLGDGCTLGVNPYWNLYLMGNHAPPNMPEFYHFHFMMYQPCPSYPAHELGLCESRCGECLPTVEPIPQLARDLIESVPDQAEK